jgi:peptide/nickel transport system ATP-binding protein
MQGFPVFRPRLLLQIENLHTAFQTEHGTAKAVDGLSFQIQKGETLALVGESGCGKSTVAMSILRLLSPENTHFQGKIHFDGQDLLSVSEEKLQTIRGNGISMIFQEPMTSLNPVMRIGEQISEALILHQQLSEEAALEKSVDLLEQVRLPDPRRQVKSFPHELSGGMKQRVMIAMALACRPQLLIADEPTTALDVTVQEQILSLIKDLQQETQMSVLLITHNLGVVRENADRVGVMYGGRLVEQGDVLDVLRSPMHPYTQKLLDSVPSRGERGQALAIIPGTVPPATEVVQGCRFAERCHMVSERCRQESPDSETHGQRTIRCWNPIQQQNNSDSITTSDPGSTLGSAPSDEHLESAPPLFSVAGLKVHFPIRRGWLQRTVGHVKAVDGVDLLFQKGETVALVGESGCGKTTVGRSLLRLIPPTEGEVKLGQQTLAKLDAEEMRALRSKVQFIFQDPYSSLNPRMKILDILGEGMKAQGIATQPKEIKARARQLLKKVQLNEEFIYRYPHEFSGGQRQRIGIARALAVEPEFLVCDEITSALDVSVQAQILNLLKELQKELGLTYLFITHDLSVVRYLADQVAVMYLGRIVEQGSADAIFNRPLHPYTKALFAAAPDPDPDHIRQHTPLSGDVPSPASPPPGCHFAPRCPLAEERCHQAYPSEVQCDQQRVSCHLVSR